MATKVFEVHTTISKHGIVSSEDSRHFKRIHNARNEFDRIVDVDGTWFVHDKRDQRGECLEVELVECFVDEDELKAGTFYVLEYGEVIDCETFGDNVLYH